MLLLLGQIFYICLCFHSDEGGSDDEVDQYWVTVFGFPSSGSSYILSQFSQCGTILKYKVHVLSNRETEAERERLQKSRGAEEEAGAEVANVTEVTGKWNMWYFANIMFPLHGQKLRYFIYLYFTKKIYTSSSDHTQHKNS